MIVFVSVTSLSLANFFKIHFTDLFIFIPTAKKYLRNKQEIKEEKNISGSRRLH